MAKKHDRPGWLKARTTPLLFAHRGCSGKAPENTMSAFKLARDYGIEGIELDVRKCGTGEIIVFHDPDFRRIGGLGRNVDETPWKDIQSLDAGSWAGRTYEKEKIPLLTDVLTCFGDRFIYDIEIKHKERHPDTLEKELLDIIRDFNLAGRCLVSSFNPFSIRKIRELDREIPTAIIYANHPEVPPLLRRGSGRLLSQPAVLKPRSDQVSRWSMFVKGRLAGYPIIPWTVNTREEAARLLALGAEGLTSDCPEELGI